jgi:hypothetical protein
MLNPLNNDIVLHQGTIIGTAVLYTDTIYPVLSEEDETEIENLNTLLRLQSRLGGCFSGFDEPVFIVCSNKFVVPRSSSSLENTCSNLFKSDPV